MYSYVFISHCFRLLFLLALIASITSVLSPISQVRADQDHITYLPIIRQGNTEPPPPTGTPEQQALDRLNYYRGLAGSPLLQLHPALIKAAQNHANYDLLNYADDSAWVFGGHGEVEGKPGYTGRWPGERAAAVGYPWQAGWEVMDSIDDPLGSVDGWLATVFHRIVVLDPNMQYMGYGHGQSRLTEFVDVVDIGRGSTATISRTQVILFPAAGQINVPVKGEQEFPSPLPPEAPSLYGYPITVQPTTYLGVLTVTRAELRDSAGRAVALHPNPSDCGTTCYALIPINPLQKAMTYTVHVVGAADDTPFDTTWTFTTTN
jgi:hypothetical protein